MKNSALFALAMVSIATAGCTGFEDPQQFSCAQPPAGRPYSHHYKRTLPELTYAAIDKMTLCARPEISPNVPVIVSSLTDSRRLESSSTFGNIVADFARSRLAQNRMDVSEFRLRSAMLLKQDQGEMMLSRNPGDMVKPPPLYSAVLTGTYAVGDDSVFVSLKLIRSDNAQILSAADFVVWHAGDADRLLGDSTVVWSR
jgi:hypothetical protein